jgi:hypothetical protein
VPERIARAVVVVATLWFSFTAIWGMAGTPGGGHIGAGSLSTVLATLQMLRWKIIYPAWEWYSGAPPAKTSYAVHHPWGCFYLCLPFLKLLGHRDIVVHLPAALLSTAGPPLLYGIAKERWGAPAGAVAAAAYVVVPLAVGYSNFWGLEPVTTFGALLFFWGHSRHMTTNRRRYLAASLVGLVLTCAGDWAGYFIAAVPLAWSFVRAFLLPKRMTPRFRLEPYARWWALCVAVALGTALLWVGLFYKADMLGEWVNAGTTRARGNDLPLRAVLDWRKDWIDFSFTPLAILLGKIAAPVALARLLVVRRDEEVYSLALLFGATLQYLLFKQGADVHIFWPLYFGPYFALALAQLTDTVAAAAGWLARRAGSPRAGTIAAVTTLVVGLAPSLAMAHDGVTSLWVWRRTSGRYDDRGTLIRSGVDLLTVVKDVAVPRSVRGSRMDAHPSADWYWDAEWAYEGLGTPARAPTIGAPPATTHPFWISRASGLSSDEQRHIAQTAHVRVYGDTWLVDQREPAGLLDAFSMNEREPNPLEWLYYGGTERIRRIGAQPDPWLTWEWRVHLGQDALTPTANPVTLDEQRIAHNVAVAAHDEAGAQKWLAQIESKLDRSKATEFEGGLRLLGVRLVGGVEPRVESWFLATKAPPGDGSFRVRSTIVARAPLSLIPVPKTEREMAYPPSMPTKLWREGFLYKTETILNHRIGRERYAGRWEGGWAPHRVDGLPDTTLAIVP